MSDATIELLGKIVFITLFALFIFDNISKIYQSQKQKKALEKFYSDEYDEQRKEINKRIYETGKKAKEDLEARKRLRKALSILNENLFRK